MSRFPSNNERLSTPLNTSGSGLLCGFLSGILSALLCGLLCLNGLANSQPQSSIDSTVRCAAGPGNEAGTKGTGSAGFSG
jgi:hypothetical protein